STRPRRRHIPATRLATGWTPLRGSRRPASPQPPHDPWVKPSLNPSTRAGSPGPALTGTVSPKPPSDQHNFRDHKNGDSHGNSLLDEPGTAIHANGPRLEGSLQLVRIAESRPATPIVRNTACPDPTATRTRSRSLPGPKTCHRRRCNTSPRYDS